MQHLYNVVVQLFEDDEQLVQYKRDGYIEDRMRMRIEVVYTGRVESTALRRFLRAQAQGMSDPLFYDIAFIKDGKLVARVRPER